MNQPPLFITDGLNSIVNVASVPKRSPFRYPGGKTWLIPRIRLWLRDKKPRPTELIEPFAGGGIVSLTVAAEGLADRVTMVELDREVAAVWQAVLNGDAGELADKILSFNLTAEAAQAILSKPCSTPEEKAFRTILKNWVNRGGILAAGAGLLKNGENGRGLMSRWYPKTLSRRILEIASMKDRIKFVEGDGLEVLSQNSTRSDVVFFIDPPYSVSSKRAGSRLYNHFELDHERLFEIAETLAGDFLMTYDNAKEVRDLAKRHGFDTEAVAMKNTHHAAMTELLISRDLSWIR